MTSIDSLSVSYINIYIYNINIATCLSSAEDLYYIYV